ncbi:MAG: hypothetical protein IJH63_00585 [Methanobrevibacter sp.]|nr:hypothetical protein [Methanosphaera sp.]MBR0369200.1 hypothetical protein [Methanobrevibacter sp.]
MNFFTTIYPELENTEYGDLNDLCPDHEIKYEIESYIFEMWAEEAEFEDLLKHEPQPA